MIDFCTVADINFKNRIVALKESLYENNPGSILHLLCLDDEIYDRLNGSDIQCYKVSKLMEDDDLLMRCRNNDPSREALLNTNGDVEKAKYLQFIWSLSAYFSWWCLDTLDVPEITFVDGDIYFYSNLDTLKESITNASVGIVEHRCPYNPVNGKYNVGIVYFNNDIDGYKCSTWWKNCMLLPNNEFYQTHGMCGDQKYLELFEELFDNVEVIDKNFGHLAPWNFIYHSYNEEQVVWQGTNQDVLYCHFSNFIKRMADKYYNSLKEANEKT